MPSRFDAYKEEIDRSLSALLRGRNPRELYEPMGYVLDAGGKRIRPMLVLLAAEAVGGRAEVVLPAALALEILHTFTLVHDDIMDRDALRRGRPTVHTRWDEATAILAGDGLVTLAYQTLLSLDHPALAEAARLFTDGLLVLCEGQAMDKAFELRETVSVEEYTLMIQKKTAKLLEVACEVGAVLGGATPQARRDLGDFAGAWGEAFQIQDDLLDIMGDEAVLGKPCCSDIRAQKKTYLTLHFMAHAGAPALARWQSLWGRAELDKGQIAEIRGLVAGTGSVEAARQAVDRLTGVAEARLEALPEGPARSALLSMVARLRDRDA